MSESSEAPDYEYYAIRAAIERAVADDCEDPRVAAIHLEMAKKYDEAAAGYGDGKRLEATDG